MRDTDPRFGTRRLPTKMIAAKKVKTLRAALDERKATTEAELANLQEELRALGGDSDDENGSVGNHLADDGSNVQEQERILRVEADLQGVLTQINEAYGRMDDGSYGTCARCGNPIAEERLEYLPFVAYCIECQTILERQNGGM
jgi:DnaK suppressor protein